MVIVAELSSGMGALQMREPSSRSGITSESSVAVGKSSVKSVSFLAHPVYVLVSGRGRRPGAPEMDHEAFPGRRPTPWMLGTRRPR